MPPKNRAAAKVPGVAPGVVPPDQRQPIVKDEAKPKPFRFKSLPWKWRQFGLCLFFHLGFPLSPLLFEWMATQGIAVTSVHLVAFTYCVSIAVTSRDQFQAFVFVAISSIFSIAYALSLSGDSNKHHPIVDNWWLPAGVMLLLGMYHLAERFNRHIVDCEPFWESDEGGNK